MYYPAGERRRVKRVLKAAIVSGLGAGSSLVIGLSRADKPTGFWGDKGGLVVAALVWLAIWATAEPVFRAYRKHAEARSATLRQDLEQLLRAALVQIHELTGLKWTEIGVHVFLVHTRWRFRSWPWRYDVQRHTARVKMTQYPPPTGITWTKGKGVIGRCWDLKGSVAVDVRAAYQPYMNATREEWDRLPADVRFGLTFEEFTRTKGYAGAILATPILTEMGAAYLGCVSVDAPGDSIQALDSDQVFEVLQSVADATAALLRSASGT